MYSDKFDKSSNISLYEKNAYEIKNYHAAKMLLILVLIKVEDQKQCSNKITDFKNLQQERL